MENYYKGLFKKYLEGKTTKDETGLVLEWLQTEEGGYWLRKYFNNDVKRLRHFAASSGKEKETWEKIKLDLARRRTYSPSKKRPAIRNLMWGVTAAVIVLIGTISFFQFSSDTTEPVLQETSAERVITTRENEQRILTLKDGSRIHLNENSSVVISGSYLSDSRTISLEGDAFFDVARDEDHPFIVRAGDAVVQVLGTKFYLKQGTSADNPYVAVTEGRILFGKYMASPDSHTVLEENMMGILDIQTSEVTASFTEVSNYLNWLHGWISFNGTSFSAVADQLSRIYGFEYTIEDEELLDMRLTANFPGKTKEIVIETIAYTLDIEAEISDSTVYWRLK